MTTKFTAQKAIFLNMKEDGLKIRANRVESKKSYKRTRKYKKGWEE